ncbi:MAG: hypothetical protein JSS49_05460 [Planctomycetes bacterium]|nr:hypothetical protein [Planctomycetota bacterium]
MAWKPLFGLRRQIRFTTLIPAAWWVLVAAVLWSSAWGLDHGLNLLSKSVADHLWYAAAVVSLCPAIAVLGSRRPGARVWTWFILVPMLFVLGWPAITLWLQGSDVRGLELELPQLIGFLLVLIMGAGNYFGTRYTVPGLLFVAGNFLIGLSSSTITPVWLSDRWWARLWATGCMALAVWMAGRGTSNRSDLDRFDRLWLDFFDQFGIVWGRRIQDRVNFMAAREVWATRLELHGFDWMSPRDSTTEARMEHTFRWLLRRFVDPEWIDQRVGCPATSEVTALSADS